MKFPTQNKNLQSFTLIELLVVLALVAILSVVVILTLNPAELLKQARDSNRLSDLSTVNTALNLFSADVTSGFMGTSTVVYVSIPDNTSSTCGSLGLPTLPTGYTYNCVTTANLRKTDGTGWIPVNFQRISSNTPISQLPVDPTNTTSTNLYYTYVNGGSWKLNTKLESQKQISAVAGTDGGVDPGSFETGNNLTLAPFATNLVGWWKFDEGSGTSAVDSSGWGKTASMFSATNPVDLYTSTGCKSGSCAYLSAASASVGVPSNPAWNFGSGSFTLSAWVNVPAATYGSIFEHSFTDAQAGLWTLRKNSAGEKPYLYMYDDARQQNGSPFGGGFTFGVWHYVTIVFNKYTSGSLLTFLNGVQVGSDAISVIQNYAPNAGFYIGGVYENQSLFIQNLVVDDVRVYNRALSTAEILALYNATK